MAKQKSTRARRQKPSFAIAENYFEETLKYMIGSLHAFAQNLYSAMSQRILPPSRAEGTS